MRKSRFGALPKVTQPVNDRSWTQPRQGDWGEGGSFLWCLHYAEKQRASNLWHQGPALNAPWLRANQPGRTATAFREEFPRTWTGPTPGASAVASAGPHEVRAARFPLPRAPHQKMENTHHKREGKRLPWRNRQRWQVLDCRERRLPPLPPTQGRPSDPEDPGWLPGARVASSRPVPRSSAPSAQQGGLELERSWEVGAPARREGTGGRVEVGKRLSARIPGARQGPRSSGS